MTETPHELLERIRNENLNVYRASAQRLKEDVGQESQIAQDYRGRLIYELLQNADDAMSSIDSEKATIAFVLDGNDLWVANSGRPLDGADVRGLCGISASSKRNSGDRRASIGHKGMGFKSVLEITDAPEVYSTTISFRFGPADAVRAVNELIKEGVIDRVTRAPVTRFPWPVDSEPERWQELRARGMTTAFRFPLLAKMSTEQRDGLIAALRHLPVTSLVFLKHLGRVEVSIRNSELSQSSAWTVARYRVKDSGTELASEFSDPGTYRVVLTPDKGIADTFLLAYEPHIEIENHRGGLDEVSWEGVTVTEVSIAVRMRDEDPIALEPGWRKLHVFLPTGEPCPYDLLISGAFNSNLSRQEIRVESEASNYNRFLLEQVARTLRYTLIPRLLSEGSSAIAVLRLLDRGTSIGARCPTVAAQALYEEVCHILASFPLVPSEVDGLLSIHSCALPPLISDAELGPAFRRLLSSRASLGTRFFPAEEYCSSNTARVLSDHGAYCLSPGDAATMLARSDPSRSKLEISDSVKVFVDPVLRVLEGLWYGLEAPDRDQLADAVRREALFPVGVAENDTARRISTTGLACFYPPRSLHGEVPLDGLCFLMQEICWGSMTPKERNQELKQQIVAWQALFDVQEFKFPVVMRASVLPALDLDRETRREREALRTMERIAAICQLAGSTSNPSAPLPYERLGTTNRALFNLSRLDVPCRGTNPDKIEWVPAYKAYFGQDWIGDKSVECILKTADRIGIEALPEFRFLLPPSAFASLLEKYRHLSDANDSEDVDIGADEVSVDEDEEAALEVDDQSRWRGFLQWLGVNQSLRPVHFHDVEDRASGWLKTSNLGRPEGWIFQKIPSNVWKGYVDGVRRSLAERSDLQSTVPYFYQLHDLEHLVAILSAASRDQTAELGRSLYEHLARNWSTLEPVSRAQIAMVPNEQIPSMRTKPARAKAEELVEVTPDFWMARLGQSPFCPTGHGPRQARQVWLPTLEVERRFGRRGKTGSSLVPTLEVDPAVLKGKARGFAHALGMRDELTPTNFSLDDARLLLERLRDLYSLQFDAGDDLRQDLREVLRPAYRNLFELLASRERQNDQIPQQGNALADAPLLATDGAGNYRFLEAKQVFYSDHRDTRERIESDQAIWTFVIDALQGARSSLIHYFGVRVLEDSLNWYPRPGDPAFDKDALELMRSGLNQLAPYILARIAADRSDDRLARIDARRLRHLFELLEPVTTLELGCDLDGRKLDLGHFTRDAFVRLGTDGEPTQAFVVWGELSWPPNPREAEAIASTLCDVFGSGYFEPFLALFQAKTTDMCERLLRRAGAPLDIDDRRMLFLAGDLDSNDSILPNKSLEDLKTVLKSVSVEQPAIFPNGDDQQSAKESFQRVPLYFPDQLLVEGEPIVVLGESSPPPRKERNAYANGSAGENGNQNAAGGYGGRTDLELLNNIGMSVALAYELNRLRRSGLNSACIFDPSIGSIQPDALVFDISTPDRISKARVASVKFDSAMKELHSEFGISPEWPGFDVLTLDPRLPYLSDRLIELKSSGVASRTQDMTWNEWKTATSSTLRDRFYLYLVGNLRSDLDGSKPYIRTIMNPFEQLIADIQVNHNVSRKVQLAVHFFKEAEHLELSVRAHSVDVSGVLTTESGI
jgi:hypothetical protein